MGVYDEAWDKGQAEKQAAENEEKRKELQKKQDHDRALEEANNWIDHVFAPAVQEAKKELQSKGIQVEYAKVPGGGDPAQASVQIRGSNKAVSIAIQAAASGTINLSDTLTNNTRRESRSQMYAGEVTRWLAGIINLMSKSRP